MNKDISKDISGKAGLAFSLKQAIENCFKELEEKNNICKEYLNHLVRLKAEFENYKKRVERERQEYIKFANEQLLLHLLPVFDNLKLALENVNLSKNAELINGIKMIFKSLEDILIKNGLSRIESRGNIFDPHMHEAVEFVESDEFPENTVLEEIKEGYVLNGKVIRPARVKISKKPDGAEKRLL
ncbi:nucleotide exchange factor GrpE [Candidatus Desantisbacteria bacterium CG1_02_38_46]|uniref:Protein GrpE n=2 Tax=unclassified Candidatus Desantisiibacteriota TaxID=3106372 RepID=A0A2H9PD44_9BACT|nr:MAG: nucleotide exchange factor GrpE [Candidatus Desantisbacteria bacterium CG1_02_38_46]PIZ17361.1 MAG: nucleotide exchange factor GrpE [Candidatus Desantisbacteria bacterium CG_4_10_14_0_8_um_filter_39_17]